MTINRYAILDVNCDYEWGEWEDSAHHIFEASTPEEIMAELRELEKKIGEEMDALEKLLGI